MPSNDTVAASPVDETPYAPGWPPLKEATIRPGVALLEMQDGSAICTSNFVFESLDNRTLYIGTAAHCLVPPAPIVIEDTGCGGHSSLPLGSLAYIQGASKPGILAYSSWVAMTHRNEADSDTCYGNDFALIQIAPEDRGRVHPALLHYGGPVGLANSTGIQVKDRVLSFGNSSRHEGVDALQAREGYVVAENAGGWEYLAVVATPGVPGDSGSAVLDSSGRAVGVLTSLHLGTPAPGSNGFVSLDKALDYARKHGGIDVRLATWGLLEGGTLPDLP
jgi:hypothetical protein